MPEAEGNKPERIGAVEIKTDEAALVLERVRAKAGQGREKERLFFLSAVILEGLLILFFASTYLAANKKNVDLKLGLKKAEEEFTQKEQALSAELETLRSAEKKIKEEIKALEASKAEAEAQLKEASALSSELNTQLETAKKEAQEVYKKFMLELRKTELLLLAKLEIANKENLELQNKLFKLTALTQAPKGPARRQAMPPEAEDIDVNLEKIVVKPKEERLIEGKVVRVDPKYGFIIFDLGEKQEIKAGSIVEIYRGNLKISEVSVNEVYSNMSFGLVVKEKTIRKVSSGDQVVFRLPLLPPKES